MTPLNHDALKGSPYDLSDDDVDALIAFAGDCSRLLGSEMRGISLSGEPDAPVLSVIVTDDRQRPGVLYSYDWRLRDLDDPGDADIYPLGVMLVDSLGNNIMSDLQSSPGLPMWEPDGDGIVHVDVRSERYRAWPQEWLHLGRPWRDEAEVLRHADRKPG
jgi:hypothetical protein